MNNNKKVLISICAAALAIVIAIGVIIWKWPSIKNSISNNDKKDEASSQVSDNSDDASTDSSNDGSTGDSTDASTGKSTTNSNENSNDASTGNEIGSSVSASTDSSKNGSNSDSKSSSGSNSNSDSKSNTTDSSTNDSNKQSQSDSKTQSKSTGNKSVEVKDVEASKSDNRIVVPIYATENPGIVASRLFLTYDTNTFDFADCEGGEIFDNCVGNFDKKTNTLKVIAMNGSDDSTDLVSVSGPGVLCNIILIPKTNAKAGTYTLTVGSESEYANLNDELVQVKASAGKITLK